MNNLGSCRIYPYFSAVSGQSFELIPPVWVLLKRGRVGNLHVSLFIVRKNEERRLFFRDFLCRGEPEHFHSGLIDHYNSRSLGIQDDGADDRAIEQGSVILLALAQFLFRLLALGDIAPNARESDDFPYVVPQRGDRCFGEALDTVFADCPPWEALVWYSGLIHFIKDAKYGLDVIFYCKRFVAHSNQLFPRVSQVSAHRTVDKGEVSTEVNLEVGIFHLLQYGPVSLFRFPQRFLCLLALGDVTGDAKD